MRIVTYRRRFRVQMAHLNGQKAYDHLNTILTGGNLTGAEVSELLGSVHGHNLKIEVEIVGSMPRDADWLVSDIDLTSLVNEWENANLSVHPDFIGEDKCKKVGRLPRPYLRATTENMALVLRQKIVERICEPTLGSAYTCKVTVWENDDICATAG